MNLEIIFFIMFIQFFKVLFLKDVEIWSSAICGTNFELYVKLNKSYTNARSRSEIQDRESDSSLTAD